MSAFDRVLGAIPFKGQVLNQLSAWWFEQTRDVVANHVLSVPDPNVTIAREAEPLPVEVIVRGYITGVTSTSLWTLYSQGVERPYGLELPPGLHKNDPLPKPVVTPTTKATGGAHDERLTPAEVVERGLVEAGLWAEIDRQPLGSLPDTLLAFLLSEKAPDLEYVHRVDDAVFSFDTTDIRSALGDVPLDYPSVRWWLAGFLQEGEAQMAEKRWPMVTGF